MVSPTIARVRISIGGATVTYQVLLCCPNASCGFEDLYDNVKKVKGGTIDRKTIFIG